MISRVSTPTGVVAVTPITRLPPLNVGDVIAVRVARHMADNVMRLVSGTFQLDVEGEEMLPVGARAKLAVERGADGVRYHVSPEGESAGRIAAAGAGAPAREAAALARITDLATRLAADQDGLAPLYAGASAAARTMAALPPGNTLFPPAVAGALAAILGFRLDAGGRLDGTALRQALMRIAGQSAGGTGQPPPGLDTLDEALAGLLRALRGTAGERQAPSRQATPPPLPGLTRHPRGERPARASGELLSALGRRDGQGAAAMLAAKSEAALARGRLAALASRGLLADAGADPAPFDRVLDLPLLIGGETAVISLQIGRDDTPGHEGEGAHAAWRLRFALDTDGTGPVEAVVGLDGARLFASIWAVREEIRMALNQRLPRLAVTLADLGLEVMDLKVLAGLPDDPPAASGQFVDRVS
jgi:hypothetical protein